MLIVPYKSWEWYTFCLQPFFWQLGKNLHELCLDLNARFEFKYFKDKVLIILSWFWHFVHLMSSSPDISLLWICKSERIPINFAPPICPIVIVFKCLPASFIIMFCIPCKRKLQTGRFSLYSTYNLYALTRIPAVHFSEDWKLTISYWSASYEGFQI